MESPSTSTSGKWLMVNSSERFNQNLHRKNITIRPWHHWCIIGRNGCWQCNKPDWDAFENHILCFNYVHVVDLSLSTPLNPNSIQIISLSEYPKRWNNFYWAFCRLVGHHLWRKTPQSAFHRDACTFIGILGSCSIKSPSQPRSIVASCGAFASRLKQLLKSESMFLGQDSDNFNFKIQAKVNTGWVHVLRKKGAFTF